MSGRKYIVTFLFAMAISAGGGFIALWAVTELRVRPASAAPTGFVVVHPYGVIDGYTTGMFYDPRADTVCWYRSSGISCLPRDETDISIDEAMQGAR